MIIKVLLIIDHNHNLFSIYAFKIDYLVQNHVNTSQIRQKKPTISPPAQEQSIKLEMAHGATSN